MKKGGCGVAFLMSHILLLHSHHLYQLCRLVLFFQWKGITYNRLVLDMVKVTIFSSNTVLNYCMAAKLCFGKVKQSLKCTKYVLIFYIQHVCST